ncbi:hypothetical protein CB1_001533046 [Camelus ferus]|nr:hypothetical protein CB1_001533046 [Camelus ferus]
MPGATVMARAHRFGFGQAGRVPSSVNALRVLSTSTDLEAAVADALKKPVRRRYEPYGMYSDDDANSDASSVCSERSYGSRNGGVPHYLRQTEDVAEVLNHCASSNWSERKEGLLGLQNLLKSQRTLSRVELKRLCEIFTRMFADPHSKELSPSCQTHPALPAPTWGLLLVLGSQESERRALLGQLLSSVKVAILKYIESLARQMDPTDFVNSSETRLAVSRIITWTTEPKSSDVRKGSPSSTIGRTPSRHTSRTSPLTSPTNCSHGGLSPSMLDYDTENLNSEEIYSSLRGVTEAIEKFSFRSQEDLNEPNKRDGKKDCDIVGRDGGASEGRGSSDVVEGGRTALDNKTSLLNTQPPRAFPGPRARDYSPYPYAEPAGAYDKSALKEAVFDDDMEQLRGVPIDHSDLVADLLKELSNHNERVEERKGALLELLKVTREDSLGVWEEHFKTILLLLLETLGDKDHSIRALALRVLREILRNQPARFKNYAELTIMKTLEAHKDSHKEVGVSTRLHVHVWCGPRLDNVDATPADDLPHWLQTCHGPRPLGAFLRASGAPETGGRGVTLVKMSSVAPFWWTAPWDVAPVVELLPGHPPQLTIGSAGEAVSLCGGTSTRQSWHRTGTRVTGVLSTVVRAAEEAASTLASSIHPEQCIKVLCPIIQTADYPINLAAIKMQTKVVERIAKESLLQLLVDIIPGLLQGYDNTESSVRKASVFCLVAIYSVIGEELKPHLAQLTGSKECVGPRMVEPWAAISPPCGGLLTVAPAPGRGREQRQPMKLLNLYIKRAQTTNSNSSSSSDVSTHS